MSGEEIIQWIAIISAIVSLPLSVILAFRKLHKFDRIFPLIWQLVYWFFVITSFNHGFPGELFRILVFETIWLVVALILSSRLLKKASWLSKFLAWSLIVQGAGTFVLGVLYYISSCWRHYGHVVWNP